MNLRTFPAGLKEANAYVGQEHRHHAGTRGHKFSIGASLGEYDPGSVVGFVIVGRPVARGCDARRTAEVARLVTNGTKNACSFLYAAAARACEAMGYEKVQTYILEDEPGTSLIAAGWSFEAMTAGGDWNNSAANAGMRRTDQPMGPKQRWSKHLGRR